MILSALGLRGCNPDDAVALYKAGVAWDQSHFVIFAAIAISLLNVAFVLIQVRRRRLAERLLRESEERWDSIQDEERARIARELHDTTAQRLTAIGLNLMTLREGTVLDASKQGAFDDVMGSLQEAMRELRTYIYLLDPPAPGRDGVNRNAANLRVGARQKNPA